MRQDDRHVVVGTDGTSQSLAAVRFGAAEAQRTEASLRIVHVLPHHIPESPLLRLSTDDLDAVGRHVLSRAVQEARRSSPRHEDVRGRLLHGSVVSELVEAATGAELLALGRESAPVRWHVYTGAVTVMAAARGRCPVVSVPDTWQPGEGSHEPVVVGFRSDADGSTLLEHAFRVAMDREARLTVLHAWELPRGYRSFLARHARDPEWNLKALQHIESHLSQLRRDHPGVDVEVRVAHQRPAQALVEASRASQLVLLARHEAGPAAFHLGETARALLREAACPVMVVPAARPEVHDPQQSAGSPEGRAAAPTVP